MRHRSATWPDSPPVGQSLVEFALILPLLLVIVLGTIDVGRWVFADNSVSNAAREGMRAAIVNQHEPDIRSVVARQATALAISTAPPSGCDAATNVPDDPSGVCIKFVDQDSLTVPCSPLYVGCMAVVTVKYDYRPITPVLGSFIGGSVISTSKQPVESICTASSGCPVP